MSDVLDADDAVAGLEAEVNAAAAVGMQPAVWARRQPDRVAIYDYTGQDRTFGELNANANRVARLLRQAGLKAGDAVALACSNRAEFCDVLFAVLRVGMRCTPVNWHLTGEEIGYVVNDCEAKAVFADVRIAKAAEVAIQQCPNLTLKVAIGGPIEGFADYGAAIAPLSGEDIEDPQRGFTMLYTSGTTGRPKGVFKPATVYGAFSHEADRERDVYLCTGPAYHAAPLAGNVRAPLMNGLPIVLLDKWDSEDVLRLIERHRITHSHLVPIMFQRLLALPPDVRSRYDVSSLQRITHGAAPCPPEVKRAMIAWLGPVLREYYAGSEGGAGFHVTSEEWLAKPGTVGKRPSPDAAKILNDAGEECPVGVAGTIYMRVPARRLRVLQGHQEDPGLANRRLLHAGRHRLPRRGRLPLPHRPQRRDHHRRRGEHLPAGDRQRADQAPGGGGQLHDRRAARRIRRGSARGDPAEGGARGERGAAPGDPRLRRRQSRQVQGPARAGLRGRTAPQRGGQGAAEPRARAVLGRAGAADLTRRADRAAC